MSFDSSLSGETAAVAQTKRVDTPEVKITLSDAAQLTAFLDADTTTSADPLVITTAALPSGIVGAVYSQTLASTGGIGTVNWTISSGSPRRTSLMRCTPRSRTARRGGS